MPAKTKEEPKSLKCPNCGGDRFQMHERGKFYPASEFGAPGEAQFEIDQIACHCLGCHTVSFLPELVE